MKTCILACRSISEQAMKDLRRAGFVVDDNVPGIDDMLNIVVLHLPGPDDQIMSVWSVPREIQIPSHEVYLDYTHDSEIGGYKLTTWEERYEGAKTAPLAEDLGELPDHPF